MAAAGPMLFSRWFCGVDLDSFVIAYHYYSIHIPSRSYVSQSQSVSKTLCLGQLRLDEVDQTLRGENLAHVARW